ncbi:MAG TPA: site-specific integrase [Solirubrobacteraceae bacterium]
MRTPNGAGGVTLRPDARWQGRYTTHDEDGKALRKYVYGRSEVECRAALIAALADRNSGRQVVRRGRAVTVREYLTRWLEEKRQGKRRRAVRPKTATRYEELLRRVSDAYGTMPLAKLTRDHVASLMGRVATETSNATANHLRRALRAALSDAEDSDLVTANAAAKCDTLQEDDFEVPDPAPEQVEALWRLASSHRRGALWQLALATGARQGELLGLRWSDWNVERGTLAIQRTLQRQGGEHQTFSPKTRGSRRVILLPDPAQEALRRQRAEQAARRLEAPRWEDADLVFTDDRGGPLVASTVTKQFQAALSDAGLPRLRMHDLRHWCACLLAERNVPVAETMALLGHTRASTTLEIYSRVNPALARQAADALGVALGGA